MKSNREIAFEHSLLEPDERHKRNRYVPQSSSWIAKLSVPVSDEQRSKEIEFLKQRDIEWQIADAEQQANRVDKQLNP